MFALIHNRKAPSWEESQDGAFLLSAHSIYANSPATISGTTGYNNKKLIPEIDAGKESTPGYYYHDIRRIFRLLIDAGADRENRFAYSGKTIRQHYEGSPVWELCGDLFG